MTAVPGRLRARRRVWNAASWLTTPFAPDDFLGLVNPMWSGRGLRGRVVEVRAETADSATIVVRPGSGWAGHRAGQYLRVGVEIDGVRHHRSYSLTSVPGGPDGRIAVTVKATAGGFVSSHLVHRTRPGTVLYLEQATGEFVLPGRCPERVLFVTAGSGITPVMGMLRALAQAGAPADVVLVHVARSAEDVIFRAELCELADRGLLRLHEHHTARHGRPTPASITGLVGDWTQRETWACGPGPLLDQLRAHFQAAGIPDRLRVERFHAPAAATAGTGGQITYVRSGRAVHADGATSLLVAGEAVGALLPSGCRMGVCRTCVGRLRGGRVRDLRTGGLHGAAGDLIQTCVSAAAGPVEIDL